MLFLVIAVASCTLTAGLGQPTACTEENHCPAGYFCDAEFCSECLQCSDWRRHPPLNYVPCVKLVSTCGPCLEGYVDDLIGDGAGCIKPENAPSVAWYIWVLGFLLIACLLACAAGVVVYALRNTDTFRVWSTTATSVEAPVPGKAVSPTAPQPPPYNYNYSEPYEPARPASPEQIPTPYGGSDPSVPLVKRLPSTRGGAPRESAGSQSARVYTNPAYVRNVPPPSYDSAISDESDHEGPFVPQDEDTIPSPWTPQTHNDENGNPNPTTGGGDGAVASGVTVPALRRTGERSEDSSPPPNKMRCVEDSNNNHNRDGSPGGSGQPPSPPGPAPAPTATPAVPHVVINVLNVNQLHQRNDLSL
ncbi:hypothetical protein NE865_05973 [Phthorimaea operculella]|nr:hypothetical protein NE865_05973 [Phthorimaea operculella]